MARIVQRSALIRSRLFGYDMIRAKNRSLEAGFTLIELMTVTAIVGILASIAVPQFGSYKSRGFDARAQIDLRHVATAEEAYFSEYNVYKDCDESTCTGLLRELTTLSPGVLVGVVAAGNGFTATATHPKGTGQTFTIIQ